MRQWLRLSDDIAVISEFDIAMFFDTWYACYKTVDHLINCESWMHVSKLDRKFIRCVPYVGCRLRKRRLRFDGCVHLHIFRVYLFVQ
jgi:hypothetical protein